MIFSYEFIESYLWKGVFFRCIIKVDLRKIYDFFEWGFFRSFMLEIGIFYRFVMWIMECVSFVSCVILFNGGITFFFKVEKGLR